MPWYVFLTQKMEFCWEKTQQRLASVCPKVSRHAPLKDGSYWVPRLLFRRVMALGRASPSTHLLTADVICFKLKQPSTPPFPILTAVPSPNASLGFDGAPAESLLHRNPHSVDGNALSRTTTPCRWYASCSHGGAPCNSVEDKGDSSKMTRQQNGTTRHEKQGQLLLWRYQPSSNTTSYRQQPARSSVVPWPPKTPPRRDLAGSAIPPGQRPLHQ